MIAKSAIRIYRPWLIALAPGIVIAVIVWSIGQRDFGIGILCGVMLTVASQAILSFCVSGITSPGNWKRIVALVGVHLAKYLLIAVAIYAAVHHPQVDSIVMFAGIALGVVGFLVSQVLTNPTNEALRYSDD